MNQQKQFAEIILPLPLEGTFTYEIPENLLDKIQVGLRVAVQFGKRKIYTGIVHSLHQNPSSLYKIKKIEAILDEFPLIFPQQINFWEWMANYYMCSLGDVYKNAFPTALKLESDTFIKLKIDQNPEEFDLSDNEFLIVEALKNKSMISVHEAADIIDKNSAISVLKQLLDNNLIELDEKLIEKYSPKIEKYIQLHFSENDDSKLKDWESLSRSPKQREILLQLINSYKKNELIKASNFIKKSGATYSILNALESKGFLSLIDEQTKRVDEFESETEEIHQLSEAQNQAFTDILESFKKYNSVLLHGVTSSGKTEIYIKLIEKTLQENKNVLFLLPEIGLTTQLTQRIQKHFGNDAAVYHSKFNQNERVEIWMDTLNGKNKIIIGARSSIFLPIQNLGLIIVDEEHETSLKQNESRPYFHARDAAFYLSQQTDSKLILGSATPSLEVYQAALDKTVGYVELKERFGGIQPPEIEIVDLKKAYFQKRMIGNISFRLEEEMRNTFTEEKQVIIFQNRRGFAPILECKTCGHTPYCPNCDVTLTLHKITSQLKCHYCGHSQAKPIKCYQCNSTDLSSKGIGTEQIEDEIVQLYPGKKIRRMDTDSMRKKNAYEKLIEAFEEKEVDVIVGTQMVSKGLDFEHVNLVGIIRADSLLNFPDFRAHERAFQRIIQVAGRAGRRKQRGKVLIQTFVPDHIVLQNISLFNYHKTAQEILYERRNYFYPPFSRLIEITFRHKKRETVEKTAVQFGKIIEKTFDEKTMLGPAPDLIERINNQYRFKILIKILPNQSVTKVKSFLKVSLETLYQHAVFRSVKVDFDVDPI